MITPKKLKRGSHIRVIAPSRSMSIISDSVKELAQNRLEERGYKVSYGKNIYENDKFGSSPTESRIEDLHAAFADSSVDAVLTAIGGYNANQLLDYLDFDLISNNPKILMGFSDITILSNAIYSQTGLMTYSGPHFSSWGMRDGFEYSIESFKDAVESDKPYALKQSQKWSDDPWFIDQDNRLYFDNPRVALNIKKDFEGTIVGGHARCLAALQGTKYWPGLSDTILFIEEDAETSPQLFDRLLQSFIQQPDFSGIKGIVIGRFQKDSKMTDSLLQDIIETKKELSDIPVIANANFGHTTPHAIIPIGGKAKISVADQKNLVINIVEH